MLLAHSKSPLNAFDFEVNYYYPRPNSTSYAGILIHRTSEYEFLFTTLKEDPLETPPTQSLFFEPDPGFIWTCPERLKPTFDQFNIDVETVIDDWELFKTHTGILPPNFKELDPEFPSKKFPLHTLTLKPIKKELYPETTRLEEIPLLTSVFFADCYQGLWCLTRTNISTIFLIKMKYSSSTRTVELHSDITMFTELALCIFPSFQTIDDWEELSLSQLLEVRNLLIHHTSRPDHSVPKTVFNVLTSDEVRSWNHPKSYYNFDLN